MGAWRGEDTRGQVVQFLQTYRQRLRVVRVDAIGIGYNFGLHLRDLGFRVALVNVARACTSNPRLKAEDLTARFSNLKAQYFCTLAAALEHDKIEGLIDSETIAQLAGIQYEIDGMGRFRIEAKEKALARGLSSPDRAEALMLALGQWPPEYAFTPVGQATNSRATNRGWMTARDRELEREQLYDRIPRALRFRNWGPKGTTF